MQTLTISLIQGATRWHDAEANRAYYAGLIAQAAPSDLLVLPETMMSGFTQDTRATVDTMDGPGLAWMREQARLSGVTVTGSLAIRDGETIYNRLLWVRPDGSYDCYDKRHLFRMAEEHKRYGSGTARPILEIRGWRILPQVCYDLRFPVWLRNRRDESQAGGMDYDLALFVANWPVGRRHAWRTLLRARAIENLAFVVGVNRVGVDGHDLSYSGDSAVIDPLGEALVELGAVEQVTTVRLDPAHLLAHRQRFPAWMDADDFSLQVD